MGGVQRGLLRYLVVGRLDRSVPCIRSDRERELSEGCRQLMPRVGIHTEFVVAPAQILDECVSRTDHAR